MNKNKFKLIVWDFDGVIADTEKLWLQNRQMMLNEAFGLNWDFETTNEHLGGMSDKTKRIVLEQAGIITDDDFWQEAINIDLEIMEKGFALTKSIEEIFKLKEFVQCIASGGFKFNTEQKIKFVGIEKYFPMNKVFTADMVEHGKPGPDLFLLAAMTMGYEPQDCVVIEDSIAGMTAGIRAGMTVVAYTEYEDNKNFDYFQKIRNLGVEYIFDNMKEIKAFLFQ